MKEVQEIRDPDLVVAHVVVASLLHCAKELGLMDQIIKGLPTHAPESDWVGEVAAHQAISYIIHYPVHESLKNMEMGCPCCREEKRKSKLKVLKPQKDQ